MALITLISVVYFTRSFLTHDSVYVWKGGEFMFLQLDSNCLPGALKQCCYQNQTVLPLNSWTMEGQLCSS